MKKTNNKKQNKFNFKKPWFMYFIPFCILGFVILVGLGWLEEKYHFLP